MRYTLCFAFAVAFALTGCDEPEEDLLQTDPGDDRYALENDDVAEVDPSDVPSLSRDWPELTFWDVDGNDRIDRGELERGLSSPRWFGSWDTDGDGSLTQSEYYGGLFDRWKGEDDVISRPEYRAAVDVWFPDVEWEFMAFDGNHDGFVDPVEFEQTMIRTDTFASLDADNDDSLGQRELAEGMLQRWDDDGDGTLAGAEWRFG